MEIGSVDNVKLRCLIVRYGTDSYIAQMASDQEKFQGRLQNRVLSNRVTIARKWSDGLFPLVGHLWKRYALRYDVIQPGAINLMGKFLLPVHRRLGTQFKLFFQVRADEKSIQSLNRTRAAPGVERGDALAPKAASKSFGAKSPSPQAVPNQALLNRRPARPEIAAAREIAERLAWQYGLSTSSITEVQEYRSLFKFRTADTASIYGSS